MSADNTIQFPAQPEPETQAAPSTPPVDEDFEARCALIAREAHEANRLYCQSIGDNSQPSWEDAPDWQRESAISGVKAILNRTVESPEDSHRSWLAQKEKDGWTYGPVKDAEKKEHPCMVPYSELPPEQRAKDAVFFTTVTRCASILFPSTSEPTHEPIRVPANVAEELYTRFTYHPPKGEQQLQKYQDVREVGLGFAMLVAARVPNGREQSLALTKIEEAMFWANAGIARRS